MNDLQIFNYTDKPVRTISKDGEPWFVAKDVCDVLEISNGRQAVLRLELDEDEKGVINIDTLGGPQQMTIISESGLYALILTSRKNEAEQFKRWVRKEVIPSIRKHGAYITPDTIDKMISNPEFGIKLLTALQEEKDKRIAAEIRINEMKPKELFADSVTASKDSVLVAGLSAILKQNGIDIGEMRLWEWLRNRGYAIREKGRSWNMPTQRSLDLKVMEVKEGTRIDAEGSSKITKTTMITGKGQVYFVNKFLSREESA